MNARVALRNLTDVRDALASFGAHPFLVDGTLLGAVRERAFIAHDTDVDLGLFVEDLNPAMPAAVIRKGFALKYTLGTPDRGLQWAFTRDGIKVDVFIYYLEAGFRFHAAWTERFTVPIRYEYPAFGLGTLLFYGRKFDAPANPESFLVAKYGPGWRTPVRNWDWAWGPKNARPWREPCPA